MRAPTIAEVGRGLQGGGVRFGCQGRRGVRRQFARQLCVLGTKDVLSAQG